MYKPKLKIGIVSNSAWSVYNFRADVIKHFIQTLAVEVMVFAPDDEFSANLKELGCVFIPVHFNNRTENPFSDFSLFLAFNRLYKIHKPDVLFHYVIKPNIYGTLAASFQNIPSIAVVTGLGFSFAKRNWLNFLIKLLYRFALKRASEIWFLNNEDASYFIKHKIVKIQKVKVISGEGVNTAFFKKQAIQSNEKFVFLMSTRLLKSKGVGVYADASLILKNKNYNIECCLIGFYESHHPDSITKEEIEFWQKQGLINYIGFLKDVRPVLDKADCFVFPSYYSEGVPRCLMEAAAMQIPIVTCNNRGCKEVVIDKVSGLLCNINDPFDLAEKMEEMILLSREDRDKMGKEGRKLVEKKFNIQNIIKEYNNSLKKFIQ